MHPKIVTLGGGTGLAIVNESLLKAGFTSIQAIVTSMDSGGITGRMRSDSRGQEIAYSDAMRALVSLIPPDKIDLPSTKSLIQLLQTRNDRGQLGYQVFSYTYHPTQGFSNTQSLLETLVGYRFGGQIIPISLESSHIHFQTQNQHLYHGEHELDDKRMSQDMVTDIWLDPKVPASPQSLQAISSADYIIYSCGSLYGSIIVNLLPLGIQSALSASKAHKILLTNLASTRNETHDFTPFDYLQTFRKYTRMDHPFNTIVVPHLSRKQFNLQFPTVASHYQAEHSHFLGWTRSELSQIKKQNIQVAIHDATLIDPKLGRIRHDPNKLAHTFKRLITD